ncbi:MAG: hypothetical protein ACOY5W_01765 [Pseudomonadota bacterium]|jgi:hypothetical protein
MAISTAHLHEMRKVSGLVFTSMLLELEDIVAAWLTVAALHTRVDGLRPLVATLQEFENIPCFLSGQSGTHSHVRHDGLPQVIAEFLWIAHVMAASAILSPALRTTGEIAGPGIGIRRIHGFALRCCECERGTQRKHQYQSTYTFSFHGSILQNP